MSILEDWRIKEGIRQMIMDEAKTHPLMRIVDVVQESRNRMTLEELTRPE